MDESSGTISSFDLKRENSLLAMKVRELTAQNESLQKQFEEALEVSEKVDFVFSENAKLTQEVSALKSEKEDLRKRIEVSLKSNDELRESLASKSPNSIPIAQRTLHMETDQTRTIENLKYNLSNSELKYEQSKQENSKLELQLSQAKGELSAVFRMCSAYFGETIETIAELQPLLLRKRETPRKSKEDNLAPKVAKLKMKIKQLKSELASEQAQAQQQNVKSQHKCSELSRELENKASELTMKIHSLTQDVQQLKLKNGELSRRNDLLSDENSQLRAKLSVNSVDSIDQRSDEMIRLTKQIGELNTKLGESERINESYKEKLKDLVVKTQSLSKKCKMLKRASEESEVTRVASENDASRARLINEQWEKKCIALSNQVDGLKDEITQKVLEIQRLKGEIDESIIEMETQKKMNELAKQESAHVEQLLEQQRALTQSYQQKLNETEETLAGVRSKLSVTQQELDVANQPIDTSKLLPLAAWSCSEFPKELQTVVQDIADNPTLQAPTKLRHVLSVVARWFVSRGERIEQELAEERTSSMILNAQIDTVIQFLAKTFPEIDADFTGLLEDEHTREAVSSYVKRLRTDIQHLVDIKNKNDEETLEVIFALHVESMADAKVAIENLYAQLAELKQKYKSEKEARLKQAKVFKSYKKQLNENISVQESLVSELHGKAKLMEDTIANLTDKNQSLMRVIEEKDQLREQLINEHKLTLEKANQEREHDANYYDEACKDLEQKLRDEQAQNCNAQAEIFTLNESLELSHSKIDDLNSQIAHLAGENDELKKHYKEKIAKERLSHQTRYDQMIDQMSKKNGEYLETIKQLNQRIESLQSDISSLESQKTDLDLKIHRMETRSQALLAESNRDRKSQESQLNARVMAVESTLKSELEEQKLRAEIEMRRIVDTVNQAFDGLIDTPLTQDTLLRGIQEVGNIARRK